MIRALAIGALVSLVVVVIAVAQPFEPSKPAASASGPTAVPAGDPVAGQPLFAQRCASCHGQGGEGGGVGPNITKVTATAALAKIAAGGGVMPANLATGQDAADIAAFVDTLDGSPQAGTTTAAGATSAATTAPTTTAAATASAEARRALRQVSSDLRKGQSQINVLAQHTAFLEQALADNNVFNVRFHAEHLANITLGEPIRDLDGNGEASNPGDGVGLLGEGGYVAEATAPFVTIANDPTVPEQDRDRAVRAQDSVDLMERRLGTVVRQAEAAAKVAHATDARAEIRRIRAAVDDVRTTYALLRDSLQTYAFS